MSQPADIPPVENDEAERLSMEAAVAQARADPRPPTPHAKVREQMLRDIAKARERIAELAQRRRNAG